MTFVSANSVTPISGTSYKPVFTQTGYTLIYSNNPETIDNNNQLADTNHYLYGDTSPGRTRCFFHHANSTGNTISIRIEIVNPSNETVNLFVSNKGIGTHSNPVSAGAMAWQQWLTLAPVSGGAAGADNYVRTIGANSTDYYIALETTITNGLTAAGIMDFVAVGNTSGLIRPLRVKVYAYKNAPVFSPGSPAAIAVPYQTLGSDSSWFGSVAGQTVHYGHYGFESVVRGTFQHCTRTATVNWNSTSGSRFLELFTRHTSVFVNPNEFEAGTDVTQPSGSQTVYSPYGSDFKITFVLTDGAHKNTIYGYLQNLKDTSYVIVKHGTGSSGYGSVGPGSAWNYDITNLNGGTTTIQIWTTAIGGFSGTQQMYWA